MIKESAQMIKKSAQMIKKSAGDDKKSVEERRTGRQSSAFHTVLQQGSPGRKTVWDGWLFCCPVFAIVRKFCGISGHFSLYLKVYNTFRNGRDKVWYTYGGKMKPVKCVFPNDYIPPGFTGFKK